MSSGGYANRLSEYTDKGVCGLPESFESSRSVKIKLGKLVDLVKASKHIVVLTGAGVSTSAGIPDFRGPKGIWTVEEEEKKSKAKEKRKRKRQERSKEANGAATTASASDERQRLPDASESHGGEKARPQCDDAKISDFYNSPSRAYM